MDEALAREIRRIDAVLDPLIHYGIDLVAPGLLRRLQAMGPEMRAKYRAAEAVRTEANLLLPAMLDFYLGGSDRDRADLRALLRECRSFRWGFGQGTFTNIASEDDARRALAVHSMKDGDIDWRDEILALDHLCGAMQKAGLPGAALLREAAAWSSDEPRFPQVGSTRASLLSRAARFDG